MALLMLLNHLLEDNPAFLHLVVRDHVLMHLLILKQKQADDQGRMDRPELLDLRVRLLKSCGVKRLQPLNHSRYPHDPFRLL